MQQFRSRCVVGRLGKTALNTTLPIDHAISCAPDRGREALDVIRMVVGAAAASERQFVMRLNAPQVFVPDYASSTTARPRVSKLARAALILSLVTSPLGLRLAPYQATQSLIAAVGIGVLAIPAAISLLVALVAGYRLHRHRGALSGARFVAAAVVIDCLSLLFYVLFIAVLSNERGPG